MANPNLILNFHLLLFSRPKKILTEVDGAISIIYSCSEKETLQELPDE